jgi:propanol-preferring alcohol dehydrogenase
MKALVLEKFGSIAGNPLRIADVRIPEPGPGELLIGVSVCGICHTDLHTVEGDLPDVKLPIVPGHQVVGRVDDLGRGASRFRLGDRVGIAWLHWACGKCRFCLSGNENLCLEAKFTGYHVNGGYAQYLTVPERFGYAIPDAFSDKEAAPLLCAGIIGYRALRLSGFKPGETLGLYGFGASAHIAIQVAIHQGASVFVFSRSEKHRELARKLGASWTGSVREAPPARTMSAVVFAPAGGLVLDALRNTESGGTVALAGITMTPIPEMDYEKYIYHERTLRSVANATRWDGEELLKIAAEIPIRATTEPFPLGEANLALRRLKEGLITGAGVLMA